MGRLGQHYVKTEMLQDVDRRLHIIRNIHIVCTDLLDKEYFFGGSLMIHQTVDLLMKRYCRGDLGWILRTSRSDEIESVFLGLMRECLKLLVPFRMACHALNASRDIGFTSYNHDRRPSTGSSPSATTGRSDEASWYPSDVTAHIVKDVVENVVNFGLSFNAWHILASSVAHCRCGAVSFFWL